MSPSKVPLNADLLFQPMKDDFTSFDAGSDFKFNLQTIAVQNKVQSKQRKKSSVSEDHQVGQISSFEQSIGAKQADYDNQSLDNYICALECRSSSRQDSAVSGSNSRAIFKSSSRLDKLKKGKTQKATAEDQD